jgi:protein gp37
VANNSNIEWTEATWNPVTGCTKVSPGCKNCYAEKMAHRLQLMGQKNYRNAFELTLQPQALELPLKWKKPKTIFVNSMSDLFHEQVTPDYIQSVFNVMNVARHHTFQVLTKRSKRLLQLNPDLIWTPNILMGVSIESKKYIYRMEDLLECGAHRKFLSLEPLLGCLSPITLSGIDWVIAGGESGNNSRPIRAHWVREIRDTCIASETPFFFKQWGGANKKKAGRVLDGKTWDELPPSTQEALTL